MSHLLYVLRHVPAFAAAARWAVGLALGLAMCAVATPYAFKLIVDLLVTRTGERPMSAMIAAAAAIALLRAAVVGLEALQKRNADQFWNRAVPSLRQQVFDGIVHGDLQEYEARPVGETTERFRNILPICLWLYDLASGVLASAVVIVASASILALKAPACGLVASLLVPVSLMLSTRAVHRTRRLRRRWYRITARLAAVLSEVASQLGLVRASGGETLYQQRFARLQGRWRLSHEWEQAYERRTELLRGGLHATGFVACAVLVLAAAWQGRATAGDVLLVFALVQTILAQLQPVARAVNGVGDADAAAASLRGMLGTQVREGSSEAGRIAQIEFKGVGFAYPGRQRPILSDVSFRLSAGERLLVVGPSGSGKSTLVKLLLGLQSPTTGEILVNGTPVGPDGMGVHRNQLGVVMQEVLLANTTLFDNIRFGLALTPEDVRRAIGAAGAETFVRRLPDGLLTQVGERGLRLSGGERQRLIIARALARRPSLIVLDEATSALDAETERHVSTGLEAAAREAIVVMISHRPVSPGPRDVILRLEKAPPSVRRPRATGGDAASAVQADEGRPA